MVCVKVKIEESPLKPEKAWVLDPLLDIISLLCYQKAYSKFILFHETNLESHPPFNDC